MFLRCKVRRKDGKQHRYWSVVENTRVGWGARGAAACAVPGRDQRHAGIGVAVPRTTVRGMRGGGMSYGTNSKKLVVAPAREITATMVAEAACPCPDATGDIS